MQKNIVEKTNYLASEIKSENLGEHMTSESLPKDVSMQLFRLMTKVVENDINPKTVDAACKCANEIYKILKFNLELIRTKGNA